MYQILKKNETLLKARKFGKGECKMDCRKCHNMFEFLFHPGVYKAVQCKNQSAEDDSKLDGMIGAVDDTLDIFDSPKTQKKCSSGECSRTHCPFSHEGEKYETLQETTEFPFYKFAYNRIAPGSFFSGNSFFSSRSENLVYPEDRLLNEQTMSFGYHRSPGTVYPQFTGAQMNPQKLYFKSQQNQWKNPNYAGAKGQNKENLNNMNFGSPVNMNMYRIQMNNTFLMPHQTMGYMPTPQFSGMQTPQMKGYNGAYGSHMGYQSGFYRC